MMQSSADRLYHLRTQAGMTQADLGRKLGVQGPAISSWERGDHLPNKHAMIEMNEIFGESIWSEEDIEGAPTRSSGKREKQQHHVADDLPPMSQTEVRERVRHALGFYEEVY
jgi:transcriptional regulator with XRE-family HTH domain